MESPAHRCKQLAGDLLVAGCPPSVVIREPEANFREQAVMAEDACRYALHGGAYAVEA